MAEFADAAEALTRSRAMEEKVRGRSRWYVRYLVVYGLAQAVLVPAVLLWHGPVAVAVSTTLFALCIAGLSAFAARQRAVRRGFGTRHVLIIVSWGVLYAAALLIGPQVARDSVPFAIGAALCCAVPIAVGVRLELRDGAAA
ncbi:hypothetical protein ACGFMM_33310 [Streptomyces sp. NPDC048604]|uniref:hypothetical protein n=1 Tax=Streptomyces sp. NPDC048604 TaxID=3365578 RepID=UPI00371884CB